MYTGFNKGLLMMFRMRILTFVLLWCCCFLVKAQKAQTECEVTLNIAAEEFKSGHFHGIPDLLSPCLGTGQSRDWRQRAYLLLTETYLLLDDPIGARNSYLKVLEANPEYVPVADKDPIDLVYFSSKFTAAPIFSLFGYIGSNISQVHVLKDVDAITSDPDAANNITKKYSARLGYQFGGGAEWHYDENFSATAELSYIHSTYKKLTSNGFGDDVLEVIDKQNWIRIPMAIKFSDHIGRYRPYGYLGVSIDILRSDKAIFTSTNNDFKGDGSPVSQPPSVSPSEDLTSKRYRTNQSFFFGGGMKYKVGLNYFFVDVRYSIGMRSIVNSETAIYQYQYKDGNTKTSDELLNSGNDTFQFGHVDDIFRMNNVILSFGYIHPLYKPRELKRAKTKSILRRIKKQDDKG